MAAREKRGTVLLLLEFGEGVGRSWSLRLLRQFISDNVM
jgi:hypothetical protein